MNNNQFRRLLIDNTQKQDAGAGTGGPASRFSSTPALGSRKHSSIPMTPRQVGRNSVNTDFARQLAERNAKAAPARKWKSSAPKGVKLAAGYTDRTKIRTDEEEDDRAKRIKALEEAMKLGQLDRDTFERLVQEITGGDIASTHLVKGLDRKLLERVRRGEDVSADTLAEGEEEPDVEDAFDELAEQELAPVTRDKVEKKGQMAPPPLVAGVKRSRDMILAELKAQRKAAAEAAAAEHAKKYPSLGPGFRKVGPGGETSRIEVDSNGREILIVTDADGKEKRKVRKQKVEKTPTEVRYDLDDPKRPVNIPDVVPPKEDSEDEDIFEGVGSTYNPLANIDDEDDDDDDSSSEEDKDESSHQEAAGKDLKAVSNEETAASASGNPGHVHDDASALGSPSAEKPDTKPARRNYFDDKPPTSTPESSTADATVLAALRKVRSMDPNSSLLQTDEEARLKKRAAELAANDRDMEDLDMGFGSSRFDDADEMEREGEKVKFSEWKGLGAEDDDEDGPGGKGGKKRKRGSKKKKGDKNSAADVLMVMERQKGARTLG